MIKIWSEMPIARSKEQIADVATLLWVVFWGSIVWQLFSFLAGFADAGRAVRAGGQTMVQSGVNLGDFTTQPAEARLLEEPNLWPRDPPIRYRAKIPTSWVEITLREGKNRQVRRMTAKVGFPTLRLVRAQIGNISVADMKLGEWREIEPGAL